MYRISKAGKVEAFSDVGDDGYEGKHKWREIPGTEGEILDPCLNPVGLGEGDDYKFVVTDEP